MAKKEKPVSFKEDETEEEIENTNPLQGIEQQMATLAQSPLIPALMELLKDCRTKITTIVDKDEFHTLLNALTLEKEAELIQRVAIYIEDIKQGKLNERRKEIRG